MTAAPSPSTLEKSVRLMRRVPLSTAYTAPPTTRLKLDALIETESALSMRMPAPDATKESSLSVVGVEPASR